MNKEISALYKKEGVNPAGGCLPLLIQMPFLFAYYRMLNVAMDLRHAPWMWVHDLSAPDPCAYSADCDHHYDVLYAADDAAGGHGSGAAEDDEYYDAWDARHHEVGPSPLAWDCIGRRAS